MTARAPAAGRVVLAGSLALTATVVPAFLAGALSGRIGDDLGFGEGAAGAAVAAFFVGAGAFAVPMGRVTERYGPTAAMRTGVAISGASALAVAALATAWWQLALALLVAGSAVGLVDTGAARAFGDAVPERRHGLAFGTKEASVPAAALVAGLSIPVLADRAGWRAAFVLAALLAPLVWLVVPRLDATRPARDDAGAGRIPGALVLYAAGVALAVASATAAGTLLVPAIESRGWAEDDAGLLLALASVASITVRVLAGVRGDRRPTGTWAMLTTLITVGAAGALLLAAVEGGVAGVVGSLAVIGAGWGWTGLAFQTAVRVSSGRPAAAAGVVLTGLSVGGVAGPAAFGAIASAASYGAAWVVAAVALLLGAVAIAASRPALEPVG
ncbi:MAG: MFS transporter [Acidimicrobiia bacterium]